MENSLAPLLKLRHALEDLRALDPEMSLTTALYFVHIALAHDEGGVSPTEMRGRLNISTSGPRRYQDLLGDRGNGGKSGLQLIEVLQDQADLRMRTLKTTLKGRGVAERLAKTVA